jgi:rfaE bifunctional protein kinase chain/domain
MKAVIVGDVMVDSYLWGNVDRISPEAPVPIVNVRKHESRPGGAANVAMNIHALGATPILVSMTGDDRYGKQFLELLEESGLPAHGMLSSVSRTTTVKTRVIGNHHQLIRVDEEEISDLNEKDAKRLLDHFRAILEKERPHVVILEDYDKGILSEQVIRSVIDAANEQGIPITVDPKKKNFNTYASVDLFKPNLLELRMGMKIDIDKSDVKAIHQAAMKIINERSCKMVMVTLSEAGVFIADVNDHKVIPAHVRDISDVSGAGDTVISVASLALAAGLPKESIAALSNLAGGLVCEVVGVAPIDRQRLIKESESLSILENESSNS